MQFVTQSTLTDARIEETMRDLGDVYADIHHDMVTAGWYLHALMAPQVLLGVAEPETAVDIRATVRSLVDHLILLQRIADRASSEQCFAGVFPVAELQEKTEETITSALEAVGAMDGAVVPLHEDVQGAARRRGPLPWAG